MFNCNNFSAISELQLRNKQIQDTSGSKHAVVICGREIEVYSKCCLSCHVLAICPIIWLQVVSYVCLCLRSPAQAVTHII